jgi:hypothetical protein
VASRQPEFQNALARGLAGMGHFAQALDVIRAALTQAKICGEFWCVPELIRVQCEIRIAATPRCTAAVAQDLHDALRLARAQGAKAWESRIAKRLAHPGICPLGGDRAG